MTNIFFVTGTDTDVGKTKVSCLLLQALNRKGLSTQALKPLASGCTKDADDRLVNDDALNLIEHASLKQPYSVVNPYAFEPPIAPHIAARQVNRIISKVELSLLIKQAIHPDADITLIEGAGGWAVPINDHENYCDAIASLQLPAVLVVGMKLGCLNHAWLTYKKIKNDGVALLGWVANCIEPTMPACEENIVTLTHRIPEPCLGVVPYQAKDPRCLDINLLLSRLQMHACV